MSVHMSDMNSVIEIAERSLVRSGLEGAQLQEALAILRVDLYYGFWAGHCPICGKLVALRFGPEDQAVASLESCCDECEVSFMVTTWKRERFKR